MQLEQHFIVAVPPARVWEAFHDPELLVSCLPGASLRGPAEGGTLPLMFKVKLGPIAAAFAGTGELTLDASAHRGALSGQAADGKSNSRVKGDAAFDLTEADGGTRVGVNITFSITGSLAQFSREGIVRALADQLTRQFAENLQGVLADDALAQDEAPDAMSDTPHADTPHAHAPAHAAPVAPPLNAYADNAALSGASGVASPSSGPMHAPAVAPPTAAATATAAAHANAAAAASPAAASSTAPAASPAATASTSAAPPPPFAAASTSATPAALPRRPLPRPAAEAPALNLFSLIGAVIRDYWRKLFNRKPS